MHKPYEELFIELNSLETESTHGSNQELFESGFREARMICIGLIKDFLAKESYFKDDWDLYEDSRRSQQTIKSFIEQIER